MSDGNGHEPAELTEQPGPAPDGSAPAEAILDLLEKVEKGELNPKALTAAERRTIVACLTLDGWGTVKLQHLLKVSGWTIWNDRKVIAKQGRRLLTDIDVQAMAADHARRGWRIAEMLQQKGSLRESWETRREVLTDLIRMGYVLEAPRRVEFTDSRVENLSDEELDERIRNADLADAAADAALHDHGEPEALGLPGPAGEDTPTE